jgi:hypothetical protein
MEFQGLMDTPAELIFKQREHEDLERLTQEYLDRGGEIKVIPAGVSGSPKKGSK